MIFVPRYFPPDLFTKVSNERFPPATARRNRNYAIATLSATKKDLVCPLYPASFSPLAQSIFDMSGNLSSNGAPVLNWANTDIDKEVALGAVDWDALLQYAQVTRQKIEKSEVPFACQISVENNKGGRNLVRRLHFQDGACWLVRIQLDNPTPESIQRLEQEVHTMSVVRERSEIPVPEVYAYAANYDNVFGAPFMLMEFLPGDTIMDSFGGYQVHKGKIPENFTPDFHATLADIQV